MHIAGTNKRVYISHPYKNEEKNKAAVEEIIKQLIKDYPKHTFISPIHTFGFLYDSTEYTEGLEMCLQLLDMCDEMWVYGDWQSSTGCICEITACKSFDIPYFIEEK